jgi:hypothetical protein
VAGCLLDAALTIRMVVLGLVEVVTPLEPPLCSPIISFSHCPLPGVAACDDCNM